MNATQQSTPQAEAFFDGSTNLVVRLYERWLNEKDYEDINDYLPIIAQVGEEYGVSIVKMTKRPFGFHFMVGDRTFAMAVNSRSISYKLIS